MVKNVGMQFHALLVDRKNNYNNALYFVFIYNF